MKGLFITFEGIDGVGKSTQVKLLTKFLIKKGIKVTETREPGGTVLGEQIRELLLKKKREQPIERKAEVFLYMAARAQHVTQVIKPALLRGETVICDRYFDSTLVYQGIIFGIDLLLLSKINNFATDTILPDLTFLLDTDLLTIRQRITKRKQGLDFKEKEMDKHYEKIKKGFQYLAEQDPKRIKKIMCYGGVKRVHTQIVKIFEDWKEKQEVKE